MDDLISRPEYKDLIDEQLRFYDPELSPFHVKILELQRELLDDMPAVDAIPIEWMQEFDLYYAGISGGSPYYKELLQAWRREQEAQKDV